MRRETRAFLRISVGAGLPCGFNNGAQFLIGRPGAQRAGDPTLEKNLLYLLGETCHLSGDVSGSQFYFDRLASLYPEFRNLRAYLEAFDFRNVLNLRA